MCRTEVAIGHRLGVVGAKRRTSLGYEDEKLGDKNNWFFGWLLERKITNDLTLGGEIFHQTADNVLSEDDETGFNLGGTYDFDEHNHLNTSLGRDLQGSPSRFDWYLGWEVTY